MNTKLTLAAALLILGTPALHAQVVSASPAQATPPALAPAVTLRYKFAAGQVRRYEYDMAMEMLMNKGQPEAGAPMTMTAQMVMRQTVKSVRPADGAATISTRIESLHLMRGDQEMPLPDAQMTKLKQPFTQVMLPTGRLLSMDMPALRGGGPGMDFKELFSSFTGAMGLPEGPVKVGDSWNGAGTSEVMGIDVVSTSALASLTQKNGATLAAIHNTQAGTLSKPMTGGMPPSLKMSGQISRESSQIFDTSAGTLQSAQGVSSTDMTMTFGQAAGGATPPGMPSAMKMQMQMKFQMQRLSDTPAQ